MEAAYLIAPLHMRTDRVNSGEANQTGGTGSVMIHLDMELRRGLDRVTYTRAGTSSFSGELAPIAHNEI